MKKNLLKFLCLASAVLYPTLTVASTVTPDKIKNYDVVVTGAEPEGIAAAVSAARNGLSVLLIDERNKPGGLYTSGMLSMLDLNWNDNKQLVNQGIFKEMYDAIGNDGGFDIDETTEYFRKLLANNKVDVLYTVDDIDINTENGTVKSVDFNYDGRNIQVNASYFIDAMLEAPTARGAGADYVYGREDLGLEDAACSTLVFSLKGVNWNKVSSYLKNDNNPLTGANKTSAWGYANLRFYEPVTDKEKFQLRGLNIARENDGSAVINAFQVFDVNAMDEKDKQAAYEAAKKEIPHVIEYIRKNAVGFENATLDKVADELYIREGVRIVPEQQLTVEDSFQNKSFDNRIAYGSYPIDLQSATKDNAGGNGLIYRNVYTIPMGTIIPKGVNNVLVVGKSAGYDPLVSGSARTVPVGIAEGEAAGVMCAVSKQTGQSFRAISKTKELYKKVQDKLIKAGVTLNEKIKTQNEEQANWSYPYIQNLRGQGMLAKHINNKKTYAVNSLATYDTFGNIASLAYTLSNLDVQVLGSEIQNGPINQEKLVQIANRIGKTNFTSFDDMYEKGALDYITYNYIKASDKIYNSHAYAFMSCLVDYLRKDTPRPTVDEVKRNDLKA